MNKETKTIGNKLIWENGVDETKEPIKSYVKNARFIYWIGNFKYIKLK